MEILIISFVVPELLSFFFILLLIVPQDVILN